MQLHMAQAVLADIATPTAVQPPGTEKITTLMNWGLWGFALLCVVGFFAAAGTLVFHQRNGSGTHEGIARLGWTMAGCVLGAAAVPLVNALLFS